MMAQLENGRVSSDDTMSVMTLGSQFDEESSFGSDSEINGFTSSRQTDKYGFIGGAQKYSTESAQEVPLEVLRHREIKWLDMLNHWDRWISKRFKKVRLRCQKGIPPSLRGRAWLYLSGGKVKREQNVGKFKELDSMEGDPKWIDVIERDLHRQFPFHEMFVSRGGHGQQDLFRVLKAYTLYRPDEGYCQAQAPIAAVLLMHMPAEDAFWGLVQICEKYLPGYYSAGLEAIQLDGLILNALLKRVSPPAYRHLEKHKIEPILYMTEWYMCAFSRTLPWASVLRVWDMFLCDGVKIMFRVGLVLLKCMLGSREKLKACPGQYETMELLRALEPQYMQEGFLVHQVLELPISARDVEREHRLQLKRWRKTHGELSYKSPPRMHGAQAIMSAEPHSRQDLRQNPTIVVQYPLHSDTKSDFARLRKRSTIRKAPIPLDVPNPYALPTDPKPDPLKNKTQDKQSNRPTPSLQQSLLTTPEKTEPCSDPPASVPNPSPSTIPNPSLSIIPTPNPSLSVIPTPSLSVIPTPNPSLSDIPNPSLSVIPTIPNPNPCPSAIPIPNPSLSVIPTPNPSPSLSRTPPPPRISPDPNPTHPTELPHSSNPEVTAEPLSFPKNSNNTNNSAHLKDPPPTTDSTPLLPVNGDSVAAPAVPGLRHSFESVGSEDTYL
ncbi:TBC1 domain family member 10A isoform X2 [Pimephales promelas]|uniref:TBC1 domain family member 10A isoform X2 n=1 Tax=Pimephales promelas TaxID=90988 RepID=UPI001955DB38|nr:TBC1 domain family member 10A isoform X2 [Pimephales promelas]